MAKNKRQKSEPVRLQILMFKTYDPLKLKVKNMITNSTMEYTAANIKSLEALKESLNKQLIDVEQLIDRMTPTLIIRSSKRAVSCKTIHALYYKSTEIFTSLDIDLRIETLLEILFNKNPRKNTEIYKYIYEPGVLQLNHTYGLLQFLNLLYKECIIESEKKRISNLGDLIREKIKPFVDFYKSNALIFNVNQVRDLENFFRPCTSDIKLQPQIMAYLNLLKYAQNDREINDRIVEKLHELVKEWVKNNKYKHLISFDY